MATFNDCRVRPVNDRAVKKAGRYVLYWMQMQRRLRSNHALDYAIHWATQLGKPLVVFEGVKLFYPWSSARFHQFLLEGVRDTAADAERLGINYWVSVQTPDHSPTSPLPDMTRVACLVVTDDYPQYHVPALTRVVAGRSPVAVHAVDGNGVVPLSKLGPPVSAANHLRPRIHKLFAEAWANRAAAEPDFPAAVRVSVDPPFEPWEATRGIAEFVRGLPIDQAVKPTPEREGGAVAGRKVLAAFVRDKMRTYADERNLPDDPARNSASGLSWYLHYGYVGAQETCEAVLGPDWTADELNPRTRNKDDFYSRNPNVNAFLDETVTWRDVGYHWNHHRNLAADAGGTVGSPDPAAGPPAFNFGTFDFSPLPAEGTLAAVLPDWAKATLGKHAGDVRDHLYTLDQFEHADTHDELWNAAQRQLVATGRIHNYLRMLWGKKVLEWSPSAEEAYRVLEHLNNKYAIDGRDPNSYTGLLWVFGLFDRPWPGDRKVYGSVRYMSSESAAKKFDLSSYLSYIRKLEAYGGTSARQSPPGPGRLV